MHMFMWLGFDLGPFLFPGLNVSSKVALAATCIVLFIIAFLFEASKVYVARTQRSAAKRLTQHARTTDERRNLLWHALPELREAGPSQSAMHVRVPPVSSTCRILINLHQSVIYLLHNTVGFCLMLAVMLYNLYLVLAVVLGMMAGYFVFGPMLTKLQMECFIKEGASCTTECDDNAEGTTPPLLHTSLSSESDFFACQTPSCSRPGDSTPAAGSELEAGGSKHCHFGAKSCPSKVAVAKKFQSVAGPSHCHSDEGRSKDVESKNLEDARLLRDDAQSSCPSTPPALLDPVVRIVTGQPSCCSSQVQSTAGLSERNTPAEPSSADSEERTQMAKHEGKSQQEEREESPQMLCCHNTKLVPSESIEKIL